METPSGPFICPNADEVGTLVNAQVEVVVPERQLVGYTAETDRECQIGVADAAAGSEPSLQVARQDAELISNAASSALNGADVQPRQEWGEGAVLIAFDITAEGAEGAAARAAFLHQGYYYAAVLGLPGASRADASAKVEKIVDLIRNG